APQVCGDQGMRGNPAGIQQMNRLRRCGEVHDGLCVREGAATVAEKDADLPQRQTVEIRHSDVRVAVAVEVADHNRIRTSPLVPIELKGYLRVISRAKV